MSRCFPYPPPWYTPSRTKDEALIESIKLQREKEKAKELRKKEKRREKREKRKAEKEKRSQNLDKSDVVNVSLGQKNWTNTGDEILHKRKEADAEQFERSSLSEEHGEPVCLHAPSSSSDSTENSQKRRRHSSPVDGRNGHGNSILIRLPSKKLCSTSERIDLPSQSKDNIHPSGRPENLCCMQQVNSNIGQDFTLKTSSEEIRSAAGQIKAVAPLKTGIQSVSGATAASTSTHRRERKYKKLFESWVPPQLQDTSYLDADDLDWLLLGKNEDRAGGKRQRLENYITSCSGSSGLGVVASRRFLARSQCECIAFRSSFLSCTHVLEHAHCTRDF